MIRNVSITLIVLCSVLMACNNDSKTAEAAISDTAMAPAQEVASKPAFDKAKGVTAISPNLYHQVADTLNIRMIEGTYKPGDSSTLHAHPDFAMYVLEGSLVELTGSDGSKQNIEFKKGMSVIMPASTHSAKNIGNGTLKLIVVEVDRPRS